jgi:hypothetical protein
MTNTNAMQPGPSLSIDEAAAILRVPVVTLRRAVERNAGRGSDGCTTSATDGIRARKFDRRWRVALDSQWLDPLKWVGGAVLLGILSLLL